MGNPMSRFKMRLVALVSCFLAFLLGVVSTCTFCWFNLIDNVGVENGTGYVASSFFARGDGTQADPYIINEPIHLYNLAWLQYLGFFNQIDNGAYVQTYFAIETDLDMTGYILPPIGTTANPFIGNFDGGGFTVSNLKVSNTLGTDNIVSKPSLITSTSLSGVNIVGFFGVVGDLGTALSGATYSSSVNTAKNFKLNNVLIKSDLSSTMIGLVAGYVNAVVDNVGVLNSSLNVKTSSTAYDTSLTSNISDFSLYGYCTSAYKATIDVDEVNMMLPSVSTSTHTTEDSGDANDYGGSVNMSEMYTRLTGYSDSASTLDIGNSAETYSVDINGVSTLTASTAYPSGSIKSYYDSSNPGKGRYTFSTRSDSTTSYLYLYGAENFQKSVTRNTVTGYETINGYYLYDSNGNYITTSDGSSLSIGTGSSTSSSWFFDNGSVFTTIDDTKYYLTYNYTNWRYYLSLTTTDPGLTWTYSNSRLSAVISNRTRYVYLYNSSSWALKTNTSSATLNRSDSSATFSNPIITTTTANENNGASSLGTYFPLNLNKDGSQLPSATNSGYVVSGSTYHNGDTSTGYPYRSGDIRVSQYAIGEIYTSLGYSSSGSASYSDSRLEVLTQVSAGSLNRISDDYNSSNSNNSFSGSYTKTSYSDLGLQKYANARSQLSTVLSGSSYIYGLHFMNGEISTSNLITAEEVTVNKETVQNYQLPQDSIDFNLQKKGYINFFAGTYFDGNDAFFSFHQIERSSTSPYDIVSIKQISQIYKNSSVATADYIYKYSDGTYSETLPSSNTMIFDVSWITNPGYWEDNSVYYYEIPVNPGEYALGSVTGKTGAYLLYLDISANAQEIDRTTVVNKVVTTTSVYQYPLGAAFLAASTDTVDAVNSSAVLSLSSSFAGTIAYARTANVISLTTSDTDYTSPYVAQGLTLKKSDSEVPITPVAVSSSTVTVERMTYIDYNVTEGGDPSVTVITDTTDAGGTTTRVTEVDGVSATNSTDEMGAASTTTMIKISYAYAPGGAVTFTFDFAYAANLTIEEGKTFYDVTSFTLTTTSEATITVYVEELDMTYAITLNGSAAALS